jgi:hypothetical protein
LVTAFAIFYGAAINHGVPTGQAIEVSDGLPDALRRMGQNAGDGQVNFHGVSKVAWA